MKLKLKEILDLKISIQLSIFKRVIFDELATCKSHILNEMRSLTNKIIGDMNENEAKMTLLKIDN